MSKSAIPTDYYHPYSAICRMLANVVVKLQPIDPKDMVQLLAVFKLYAANYLASPSVYGTLDPFWLVVSKVDGKYQISSAADIYLHRLSRFESETCQKILNTWRNQCIKRVLIMPQLPRAC